MRGRPKGSGDLSQRPAEERSGAYIAVSAVTAVLQAVHLRTSSMLDAAAAVPRNDNVPGCTRQKNEKRLEDLGNKMPVTTTGLT